MQALHYNPTFRKHFSSHPYSLLDNAFNPSREKKQELLHNLVVVDDHHYILTLAVPGFEKDELDIQLEKNTLIVRGNNKEESREQTFIHQGIVKQNFEKQFRLDKSIKIEHAELQNGLLQINLTKEIPEELKPVSIAIHSTK